MQHRYLIQSRKPQLIPSAAFKQRMRLRRISAAIVTALTATVLLRA